MDLNESQDHVASKSGMKPSKVNSQDLFAGIDDMPVKLDEEFEQERKYQGQEEEDRERDFLAVRLPP